MFGFFRKKHIEDAELIEIGSRLCEIVHLQTAEGLVLAEDPNAKMDPLLTSGFYYGYLVGIVGSIGVKKIKDLKIADDCVENESHRILHFIISNLFSPDVVPAFDQQIAFFSFKHDSAFHGAVAAGRKDGARYLDHGWESMFNYLTQEIVKQNKTSY